MRASKVQFWRVSAYLPTNRYCNQFNAMISLNGFRSGSFLLVVLVRQSNFPCNFWWTQQSAPLGESRPVKTISVPTNFQSFESWHSVIVCQFFGKRNDPPLVTQCCGLVGFRGLHPPANKVKQRPGQETPRGNLEMETSKPQTIEYSSTRKY